MEHCPKQGFGGSVANILPGRPAFTATILCNSFLDRLDPRGYKIRDLQGLKSRFRNPLPGLNPAYSDLPLEARADGWTFEELVNRILTEAIERYGLAEDAPFVSLPA